MRHRSLIFCVIAVLALGLIGFGYAAWSSTVTVNATVNTGKLQLGIATATTTPATGSPDYVWNGSSAAANTQGLVVGSLTESNGTALSGYPGYYSSVTEAYANVYPDYAAGYTVSVANLGTIPIALNTPTITWTGDSSVQADYTVYDWTLTDATHPLSSPLASGTTNSLASIKGVSLPAGDVAALTVDAYFNDVSPNPELNQNASGAQTITITGTQFNGSIG